MALQMFASIYVGSYEVSLKIFEFGAKKKIRTVDHIRYRLNLGDDVFETGAIGYQKVEELCMILGEFLQVTKSYRVAEYEAYASTVLKNASNEIFVLNQIFLRTGIQLRVLSNSEHRFISYQSVAGRPLFEQMIRSSAAVIDIGGIGIQMTLFRDGQMVTTQHMNLGTIHLRSLFEEGETQKHYVEQLEEYIDKKIEVFRSMYLHRKIQHLILMNDYGMELVKKADKNHKEDTALSREKFIRFSDKLLKNNLEGICKELSLSNEKDPLIIPSVVLFRQLLSCFGSEDLWVPGLNVNDGIAYDYAKRKKLIKESHDFEGDIISAAFHLARHYHSFSPHIESLSVLSTQIYDTIKKVHGMGKRERLLLKVASILHDCGKYVSLANSASCSYQIILSSEIMGLTHRERKLVALIVFYNTESLLEHREWMENLPQEDYLIVAKLSAILRVANALDQSHKQKYKNIKVSTKGRQLVFTVESMQDISLEQALFEEKTLYFENVFSMKPVLKEKRVYHV